MRLSPLNITTEGSGLAWDFSFNLFGLLMIGYQIPICLSCSLLPAVAWRTVFGEHLEAGCWIGSILAGSCAPASALRAWRLGPRSREEAELVVGVGSRVGWKGACKSTAAYVSCEFSLSAFFASMHHDHSECWCCCLSFSQPFAFLHLLSSVLHFAADEIVKVSWWSCTILDQKN